MQECIKMHFTLYVGEEERSEVTLPYSYQKTLYKEVFIIPLPSSSITDAN